MFLVKIISECKSDDESRGFHAAFDPSCQRGSVRAVFRWIAFFPASVAELKGRAPSVLVKGRTNAAACGPAAPGEISFMAVGYRVAQQIPPATGRGAPALPGELRTCLLAGTGCDTAAFAQREDRKHSPCVPSPAGVSQKSASSSPASFVFTFRTRRSFRCVDKLFEHSLRGAGEQPARHQEP